jgi:hypothetical protein
VRGNPGGNSLISEILVYYLHGREKLLETAGVGSGEHGAFRSSRYYFAERPAESLAAINRAARSRSSRATTPSRGRTWTAGRSPAAWGPKASRRS